MRLWLIFALFVFAATGCAENLDPKDPEGAYNLFKNAMWGKDPQTVWARSAPSTHEYFQERYETLVEMDETIQKYLPPTDHKIAREQAGSILTNKVKDGKGLFLEVFKPANLKLAEKHKVGGVVDQIRINEDETAAELKTLGGDVFYLSKGENEEWFVMMVQSSKAVDEQMGWLTSNESALNQTIEDLIAEERKEREAVIQELMKLKDPDGDVEEPPDANAEDATADGEEGAQPDGDEAPTEGEAPDGGQEEDSGNNGH